ncbi:MAG TPA: nucleoside hydrolase [Acidimicrobiia bacterium]|nr:nucleoside hydrolase [Acidimicrobiia bacterium]
MTTRIWIDTDVGGNPDDELALVCAIAHPDASVVGISTVSGDPAWRAREARAVVGADVAIVAGAPDSSALEAVDAFVAIGPWTNVATLAEMERLPARVVCMGGALATVAHRGEQMRVEHNVGADPAAAARVCAQVDGLVVVPLDVTARLVVDDRLEARLRAARPAVGEHIDRWRRARGDHPICLHDPLAVLVALGDARVTTRACDLAVDSIGAMRATDGARHVLVTDVDVASTTTRVAELLGV